MEKEGLRAFCDQAFTWGLCDWRVPLVAVAMVLYNCGTLSSVDGKMRLEPFILMALSLLVGCSPEQLPKEKVELLAAVAYITWGMEEGNEKFSAERVDRKVLPDGVEYVVDSKRDGPPGMSMRVKTPSECVFTVDSREGAKGYLETIDFNKATTFKFGVEGFAYVEVEGPKVYCEDEKCKDSKFFFMLEQRGENRFPMLALPA